MTRKKKVSKLEQYKDFEEFTTVRLPVSLIREVNEYARLDAKGLTNNTEGLKHALRDFIKRMEKKYSEEKENDNDK